MRRQRLLFCVLGCYLLLLVTRYLRSHDQFSSSTIRQSDIDPAEWREFEADYKKQFENASTPPGMHQWLQFAKRNHCEERQSYETLHADLQYFRHTVIQQSRGGKLLEWDRVIAEATALTDNYIAYSLQNHTLTVLEYHGEARHERTIKRLLKWLLEPIRMHTPPLSSRFVFNLHDTATHLSARATYPMFSVCKMDYFTDHQPVPSTIIGNSRDNNATTFHQHQLLTASIKNLNNNGSDPNFIHSKDLIVPWHFSLRFLTQKTWFWPLYRKGPPFAKRRNTITWRGSTTSEWETGPRFQLMRQFGGTKVHPLTLPTPNNTTSTTNIGVDADFAFTRVVQKPPNAPDTATPNYRFASHMFFRQMQHHKYILDVDGNGFTSRFPGLLRSGSVVFKSTRYREWFHGRLQPYIDYIPVNYDLSDLVEKVAWMHQHLDTAQDIVQHSRQMVENHFRPVDMQCYTYRLFLEYQTLFG